MKRLIHYYRLSDQTLGYWKGKELKRERLYIHFSLYNIYYLGIPHLVIVVYRILLFDYSLYIQRAFHIFLNILLMDDLCLAARVCAKEYSKIYIALLGSLLFSAML